MPNKAPNPTILSTNFLSTSSLSFGNSALEDLTLSSLMPNKTPNHTLPSTNFIFTSPSKSLKILQIHSLPGPKVTAFQIPRETTLHKPRETILHKTERPPSTEPGRPPSTEPGRPSSIVPRRPPSTKPWRPPLEPGRPPSKEPRKWRPSSIETEYRILHNLFYFSQDQDWTLLLELHLVGA